MVFERADDKLSMLSILLGNEYKLNGKIGRVERADEGGQIEKLLRPHVHKIGGCIGGIG